MISNSPCKSQFGSSIDKAKSMNRWVPGPLGQRALQVVVHLCDEIGFRSHVDAQVEAELRHIPGMKKPQKNWDCFTSQHGDFNSKNLGLTTKY